MQPARARMVKLTVSFVLLAVCCFVDARPSPQLDDGRELLAAQDTRHYGYPLFWYGRPFYDDDDDYAANGGHNSQSNRRSSTISYASVGAGWGR